MALTSGKFRGYDCDRSVVLFSMMDDTREMDCAVSTTALDNLDGTSRTRESQREQQFIRLRATIEDLVAQKFAKSEFEGSPAGIILRSIDFRK
jgi:hypothetical protein